MESRFAHLDALENQSIYILREAYRKFKRLAMLWSIGKDSSVMLWLIAEGVFWSCSDSLCACRYELQDSGDDRVSGSAREGVGY